MRVEKESIIEQTQPKISKAASLRRLMYDKDNQKWELNRLETSGIDSIDSNDTGQSRPRRTTTRDDLDEDHKHVNFILNLLLLDSLLLDSK